MVYQPVYYRYRHLFVAEYVAPTAELKVRSYYHASSFVAVGDDLKQ